MPRTRRSNKKSVPKEATKEVAKEEVAPRRTSRRRRTRSSSQQADAEATPATTEVKADPVPAVDTTNVGSQESSSKGEATKPGAAALGEVPLKKKKMAFERKGNSNIVKPWKPRPKHRTSSMKRRPKSALQSKRAYDARMRAKEAKKQWQAQKAMLIEAQRMEAEMARKKREDKKRRRQENEFKSAVTQVITNTQKIKKMNKKQLRAIKRTRIDPQTGAITLASPWE